MSVAILSRGSGGRLEAAKLLEIIEEMESHRVDLVIMESLSRICRRTQLAAILKACLANDVRLISINDGLDTADDDQLSALLAAMHDHLSNRTRLPQVRQPLRE